VASSSIDVLVIGAGPSGLATSAELGRLGVPNLVVERGDTLAYTWEHLYDSLVLHTAKRLSSLPGLPFAASTPRYPPRRDLIDYLHRYAETFKLPIETRTEITNLVRANGGWSARTSAGAEIRARVVVVATGIVANPYVPSLPGRETFTGRVLHSVEYLRPGGFAGQRVVVAGAGNSAGEISVELANAGAQVTLAVRSGATIVPRDIAGIPVHYISLVLGALPKPVQRAVIATTGKIAALISGGGPVLPPAPDSPCPKVPLIGLHLAQAIRGGTIRVARGLNAFTPTGVRFDDGEEGSFDAVILATGYRPALGCLGDLIHLDQCGFARRRDRVASADHPHLYFVGHNYGIQGGLYNIGKDARLTARHITATS
jgi:cation diffusion facilitator CzcD-associated flavoprotein CzcO